MKRLRSGEWRTGSCRKQQSSPTCRGWSGSRERMPMSMGDPRRLKQSVETRNERRRTLPCDCSAVESRSRFEPKRRTRADSEREPICAAPRDHIAVDGALAVRANGRERRHTGAFVRTTFARAVFADNDTLRFAGIYQAL